MKRLCVIGNSHLAAVKMGWDRVPEEERPAQIDFFASRSQTLAKTYVRDGALKSDDDFVLKSFQMTGGAPEIDLLRYDGFVVIGCGVHFKLLCRMFDAATVHPHARPGARLASWPALRSGLDGQIAKTAALRLVERIRSASSAPVAFVPEPFFGKKVLTLGDSPPFNFVYDAGLGATCVDMFEAACERAFAPYAAFVRQPAETRQEAMFTDARYSFGAVGIRGMVGLAKRVRKVEDFSHKNAEYGETVIRGLLPRFV